MLALDNQHGKARRRARFGHGPILIYRASGAFMIPYIDPSPQHVVRSGPNAGASQGQFWPHRTGAMQDSGRGLRRTPLFLGRS